MRPGAGRERAPAAGQAYIVGLTLLAAAALLVALAGGAAPGMRQKVLAAVFGAIGIIAWVYPLQFSFKNRLNFDACVFFAAILLLEPALAIGLIGAGTALAHLILREDGVQALFNSAQAMAQAAAGSLVLGLGGWTNDPPRWTTRRWSAWPSSPGWRCCW